MFLSSTNTDMLPKAWASFDGLTGADVSGTYSRISPSTTLTVAVNNHGQLVGHEVYLDFTTGTGLDGPYIVASVASANQFNVTTVASTTTSGNVTIKRWAIRAANGITDIANRGVGLCSVNFAVAMPDANYAIILTISRGAADAGTYVFQIDETVPPVAAFFRCESGVVSATLNHTQTGKTYQSILVMR